MRLQGRHILVLACVCAVAALCASGALAATRILFLASPNHTSSARGIKEVERVVVHVTEGRFWGSVQWLRNHRSHGSAHYVISRQGDIVQLVSTSDVAWHAGNGWVNRHSIGIEHEGWSFRGKGFTEAQYRASARLVAWLSHRAGMPIDRRHVIGHDEVPDPSGPGYGGVSHHEDPGPNWRWAHYLELIREYAQDPVRPVYVRSLPRRALTPAPGAAAARATRAPGSVVARNASVRGVARWWSGIDAGRRWRKGIWKVEFSVDGRHLWTDHTWPFAFRGGAGWDTKTVGNGRHMLSLRAYGRNGYRVRTSIPVKVQNPPMQLRVDGVAPDAIVRGDVTLGVRPAERVERVTLTVDGQPVSRDASVPYSLSWSTEGKPEGPHDLVVHARTAGGRRASITVPVVVANEPLPTSLEPAWWARLVDAVVR
jgi:N-acetyl-anhydromuramyl-L-alanine amidase AmpD